MTDSAEDGPTKPPHWSLVESGYSKSKSKAPAPFTPTRGTSLQRFPTVQELAPANWGKWGLMWDCTFWDGCWLTFGKEPKQSGWKEWLDYKAPPSGFDSTFSDRLSVLLNRFRATQFDTVRLADLASFALSVGWLIPDELKALARPPEPVVPAPVVLETVAPTPSPVESVAQRRTRFFAWHIEEQEKNKRGAVQRVYERELKKNSKADRGNIGRDIRNERKALIGKSMATGLTVQQVKGGRRTG